MSDIINNISDYVPYLVIGGVGLYLFSGDISKLTKPEGDLYDADQNFGGVVGVLQKEAENVFGVPFDESSIINRFENFYGSTVPNAIGTATTATIDYIDDSFVDNINDNIIAPISSGNVPLTEPIVEEIVEPLPKPIQEPVKAVAKQVDKIVNTTVNTVEKVGSAVGKKISSIFSSSSSDGVTSSAWW